MGLNGSTSIGPMQWVPDPLVYMSSLVWCVCRKLVFVVVILDESCDGGVAINLIMEVLIEVRVEWL